MHSRILVIFWRRKLLVFGSSVLFLIALWFWGFLYTTHVTEDGKIMSVKELMIGGKHEGLLQKLGFHDYNPSYDVQKGGVKFVKPTGTYSLKPKNKFYSDWDSILQDKEEKQRLQKLEMPTRDELSRRRIADELRISVEKQSHYEHDLKKMGVPVIAGLGPGGHPAPSQRLVHFDLKGAPPKITYLKRLLPIIKTLGATGILLEYEDMFPYSGTLSSVAANNAYSKQDILDLLKAAFSLGLTVIPLVQTFGHLEFALKTKEFEHLREVDDSPQALCPSLNTSLVFIEEMLDQVIEYHTPSKNFNLLHKDDIDKLTPKLTHIHIGCDEVFRMAECQRCRNRLKDQLFLDHVYNVAMIIKKKWPKLKIIIWDDMLRHMSLESLQSSGIGKLVEPMIWVYAEDIYKFIQSQTWDKYSSVFKTAWAASAFKGAHGETLMVPPMRRHLENTLRWLAVIQGEGSRFSHGIQGIALTGWQRYDHFAVLCELLPTSLPTLAVCLSTASKGYFDVNAKTNPILSSLTCPEPNTERHVWIELQKETTAAIFSRCMFPGSPVYRFIQRLVTITSEAREYIDGVKYKRAWLTDYNVRHNFSLGSRIDELLDEQSRIMNAVTNIAKNAADSMYDVYDHWTIGEYVEQRVYPLMAELKSMEKVGDSLKLRRTWPQRPLPYIKHLESIGIVEKS